MAETILPCPFGCHDFDPPQMAAHDMRGMEATARYVECPECGATGPRCATKRQAEAEWNRVSEAVAKRGA